MDAVEVGMWRHRLSEPRGEDRADYHAAQICHAIYTVISSFSQNNIKLELEDNLLKFTSTSESEDNTLKNNVSIIGGMFGGGEFAMKMVDKINSINEKNEKDTE